MTNYLATFHTHLAALKTHRSLTAAGLAARMAPVPRRISSSCGTCVLYSAENPCYDKLDTDTEAVYLLNEDGTAALLREFE
ncbi:MAG: DUF3343 domain-containing protein [Oscillospiraceae bacterium]|nr:DUF3343 domain-containing protein [Oscillospiraceae bacterium]